MADENTVTATSTTNEYYFSLTVLLFQIYSMFDQVHKEILRVNWSR